MKNIKLTIFVILLSFQVNAQDKVYNLDCINSACEKIASSDMSNIKDFASSGKVMVLPFYSDSDGAVLSYPIAMELKERLQKQAQAVGVDLTFNYLNEYNKEGNQAINHPPMDSDFDWDAYLKKFEHNYYIEGHYVIEKDAAGERSLILKNINLKPNDITANDIRKLALENTKTAVTKKDIASVLKEEKSKIKIFINSKEMITDEETVILKTELETHLNDYGYLVTPKREEAKFILDVKAKSNRTNAPFPGAFFNWIDIKLTVKLLDDPTPLFTKKWDSQKGSSNTSFDHAATTVLNNIAGEIAEQNIIKVIEDELTNNIW